MTDEFGNDSAEQMGVTDVTPIYRNKFVVECNSCGRLNGEYDSEGDAQTAGRSHAIEHAPGWTVVGV